MTHEHTERTIPRLANYTGNKLYVIEIEAQTLDTAINFRSRGLTEVNFRQSPSNHFYGLS